ARARVNMIPFKDCRAANPRGLVASPLCALRPFRFLTRSTASLPCTNSRLKSNAPTRVNYQRIRAVRAVLGFSLRRMRQVWRSWRSSESASPKSCAQHRSKTTLRLERGGARVLRDRPLGRKGTIERSRCGTQGYVRSHAVLNRVPSIAGTNPARREFVDRGTSINATETMHAHGEA